MRLDIANSRVILIAKGRTIEPLAPTQFLADAALDIFAQIVRIIFRLPERHLQHKEPLRGWFKPKCRKAQRNDLARINRVDDAPAINTISRQSIGMPRQNTNTIAFFYAAHHLAKYFAPRCLCAFRLLKFLKNFKIFFTRDLPQLKKLCLDGHDLPVIVLGALTRV